MLTSAHSNWRLAARAAWPRTAASVRFASLQVQHRDKLFIDNQWSDAEGGRTFAVNNPATEDELFQCARASVGDVDRAVKSAQAAFKAPTWGKQSSGKFRGDVLRKMSKALDKEKEEFAILESLDNGKPIAEARGDVEACVSMFDYYAGLAEAFEEKKARGVQTQDTDFEVTLVKEPIGVCGLVTPWNFPLLQSVAKVAPALAAGCSMVLKPSSVCPATSLRMGDLAVAAELPPGALNIIGGTGSEAGSALLDHPGTQLLSFTGSGAVGHTVMHSAAKRWIPTTMELGGKGAIVVFDDADIAAVVDWIMIGIFFCSGQVCSATSRLIVQKGIEGKLMERLVEETNKIRMGDPLDEKTKIGALVSKDQLDIVSGFVERARKDGVEVICGGSHAGNKGYWYLPTILRTNTDCEAWREEIFGPVLCVRSFDSEEEAVRIANDTPYGLANAVITNDVERCDRVAHQLHAGVVWKNCSQVIPTEAPFGGFGASGFGKEYGEMGLDEYVQTKNITSCKPGFSWNWYGGQ